MNDIYSTSFIRISTWFLWQVSFPRTYWVVRLSLIVCAHNSVSLSEPKVIRWEIKPSTRTRERVLERKIIRKKRKNKNDSDTWLVCPRYSIEWPPSEWKQTKTKHEREGVNVLSRPYSRLTELVSLPSLYIHFTQLQHGKNQIKKNPREQRADIQDEPTFSAIKIDSLKRNMMPERLSSSTLARSSSFRGDFCKRSLREVKEMLCSLFRSLWLSRRSLLMSIRCSWDIGEEDGRGGSVTKLMVPLASAWNADGAVKGIVRHFRWKWKNLKRWNFERMLQFPYLRSRPIIRRFAPQARPSEGVSVKR